MTDRYRIRLLDAPRGLHHYGDLGRWLDAEVVPGPPADRAHPEDEVDLVAIASEYHPKVVVTLQGYARRQIPTLLLMDGILEWRNTWEHDRMLAMLGRPILQPVHAHKVACLGPSQARLIESWGNPGKGEVVGAPRFDGLLGRRPRPRGEGEPCRILVMTAKRVGFNDEQVARATQSLRDLKAWFEAHDRVDCVRVEPVWRLTSGMDQALGVRSGIGDLTGGELTQVLEQVDAVVTTPSTAMFEAMLQGVPVALLDYHNRPHYVPAAWTITAQTHIEEVLPQLVWPDPPRMQYQDTILHEALACDSPATPRLAELMRKMAELGRAARRAGRALCLPGRLLEDSAGAPAVGEADHHAPPDLARRALEDEIRQLRSYHREEVARLQTLLRRSHVPILSTLKRAMATRLASLRGGSSKGG